MYTDKYFFHPDHLGSSSYITNLVGTVSQHIEYLPFGELLVDEHLNSHNSPFKFNAKELDPEMGNYYYGARYYDPKLSIWLSVDPLAEKGPQYSPYIYTFNNPVYWIDPDGRWPKNPLQYLRQQVNSTVNTVKQTVKNTVSELKNNFYVDANVTLSIGVQAGVKTPFGSLKAGVMTGDVVTVGVSNKEGGYVKEGDGKGHNFIEGSLKVVDNKLSLQGGIDYVTNDIVPPSGSDLLEYYPNNGEVVSKSGVGTDAIGKDSTGVIDTGTSVNVNSDCKCLEVETGANFIFGVEFKLNVGFKKEE